MKNTDILEYTDKITGVECVMSAWIVLGAIDNLSDSDKADFATPGTDAWFDGNLQKMASVSASILTAEFNKWRLIRQINAATRDAEIVNWHKIAYFDSRVFTIPDRTEVMNYFVWRNQDCSRNSVSMVAQSKFSHNELQGKSTPQMHEMLHGIGVNWATDYSDGDKNGRLIVKEDYISEVPGWGGVLSFNAERTHWVSKGAWKFTENKEKLLTMIPKYEI